MKGAATFSPCGRYRYRLEREWGGENSPTCVWWMLNPSKAGAVEDDLTIKKVCGFSRYWGFGRVVVVNMFALVSTDPAGLLTAVDPIGPDNDSHLRSVLMESAVSRIVCAWGNFSAKPYWGRVDTWARELVQDDRAVCLGRTKTRGEPRHPSRLGYGTGIEPFRVVPGPIESARVVGAGGLG